MPTYEYECTQCGYRFEQSQQISEKPLSTCPKCKQKIRRLISSGVGFIFKGAGFYATDYRKNPKADAPAVKPNSCPYADNKGCSDCQR